MITGTVKTPRGELEYFTFGEGRIPFVILPGLGAKPIVLSAPAIKAAYSCFAKDFTVYVIDRKKALEPDCTLESIADDTAGAMRALGIENACVFGASMGGMIAQHLAIKYPGLVRALALGSTAARVQPGMLTLGEDWLRLAEAHDRDTLLRSTIDNLYSETTKRLYGEAMLRMFDEVTDSDLDRFCIQMRAIMGLNTYDRLDSIACPAFVVGVEGDRVVTGEASDELAEALCCDQYMYGAEFGHCVFDEAPDYKERLLNFFVGIMR